MKQTSENYRRITKTEARRRYDAGETIRMCGYRISPDNPFKAYYDAQKGKRAEISPDDFNTWLPRNDRFDTVVTFVTSFFCIGNETGRYPAFYVKAI